MIAGTVLFVICWVKIREPYSHRGLPSIPDDQIPPMPKCKPPKGGSSRSTVGMGPVAAKLMEDAEYDKPEDIGGEISQRAALAQLLEKMDEHSSKIVKAIEDLKYGHHGTGPR